MRRMRSSAPSDLPNERCGGLEPLQCLATLGLVAGDSHEDAGQKEVVRDTHLCHAGEPHPGITGPCPGGCG